MRLLSRPQEDAQRLVHTDLDGSHLCYVLAHETLVERRDDRALCCVALSVIMKSKPRIHEDPRLLIRMLRAVSADLITNGASLTAV